MVKAAKGRSGSSVCPHAEQVEPGFLDLADRLGIRLVAYQTVHTFDNRDHADVSRVPGFIRRQSSRGWNCRRRSCVGLRSEEHTSELQSLMRISYAVFCLKKKQ